MLTWLVRYVYAGSVGVDHLALAEGAGGEEAVPILVFLDSQTFRHLGVLGLVIEGL